MRYVRLMVCGWCVVACGSGVRGQSADAKLREEAVSALRKAVTFYRDEVGVEGGYVWRVSRDLSRREGESVTTATQAWIQPPGTPGVGLAYVAAYEASGEALYRDAAVQTARALVRGQLRSGGWGELIEFDPAQRGKYNYRVEPEQVKGLNVTTLDDDKTQSALRCLMRVDRMLEQRDADIHEAAIYGLDRVLAAQYPNGAWPQRFREPVEPDDFPVLKAKMPEQWERSFPARKYEAFYTLNDNTLADMAGTMLDAYAIYGDERYLESAKQAGNFLILSQLPEPQPAWAQQYDVMMQPAWARKFEPPAVTGGESQGAMRLLLTLAIETGDEKYLEPVSRAVPYLKSSRLPEGRLPRFLEIGTNRPLYFTKEYAITYSDDDMPTHYSFKVSDNTEKLGRDLEKARRSVAQGPAKREVSSVELGKPSEELSRTAERVIRALDAQGCWVEKGKMKTTEGDGEEDVIEGDTFTRNVRLLSRYLAAGR